MTDDNAKIRDLLKSKRIEAGLTMKDVAKRVGVSEGTISRWESGEIQNMKRDKIWALSQVLDIDPSLIMGWEVKSKKVATNYNFDPEVMEKLSDAISKNHKPQRHRYLMDKITKLNDEGAKKLEQYIDDLLMIPAYVAEDENK